MLAAGGRFGDFEVVRELGRGAMGAVFLVREPKTDCKYAVKVMFAELSARDSSFTRRFIREAEIAMAVDHPNLVKVHEVGRDPETGLAFMTMEYASGGSLRDRIAERLLERRGPFPIKDAMRIIRPLLSALGEAERRGVVHRDIKPDNILFDEDDNPKLSDLGIAKVSNVQESTILTMPNVVIGTPAYMAPEQFADSHHVDTRADIYSLGIVLWELLVGERPNSELDSSALMARAMKGQRIPDIRRYRKKLSPRIVEFIRRSTDPKKERRFASAAAALQFLDDWQRHQDRIFRCVLFGAALVLIFSLSLILFLYFRWINAPVASESAGEQSPSTACEGEFSIPQSVR